MKYFSLRPKLRIHNTCSELLQHHHHHFEHSGILSQAKLSKKEKEWEPKVHWANHYQKNLSNLLLVPKVLMPSDVGANIFWQPYNGPIYVHHVYNQWLSTKAANLKRKHSLSHVHVLFWYLDWNYINVLRIKFMPWKESFVQPNKKARNFKF